MKYRAEIDGLRAFAVVPVVFFHAGAAGFSGGFVGVDVFFVISGYLITSILISEIENEDFNIWKFYERRARRILPVLYSVLLICTVISTFLMAPQQLKDFGQSLTSAVTFTSNIYFFLKTDYWAQSSEFLPLLHTWSLSVEEQYYLLYPIALLALAKVGLFNKKHVFIMMLLFLSLVLSEVLAKTFPLANFYLPFSRAWELLFGAVAALSRAKNVGRENGKLAFIGLLLLIYSIFVYDDLTPFPSIYALLPVLGAYLIIVYSSYDTIVGKVLGNRYIVFVGLLSYSIYLWHQPVLAFARIYQGSTDLDLGFKILSIFLVLLLSILSYNLIEQPFRNRQKISSRGMLYVTFVPLLVFFSIGMSFHFSAGLKSIKLRSLSPEVSLIVDRIDQAKRDRNKFWEKQLDGSEETFPVTSKMKVLFLGDSLSEDLFVVTKTSDKLSAIIEPRRLALDDECAKHLVTKRAEINHNRELCSISLKKYYASELFEDAQWFVIAAGWLSNANYLKDLLESDLVAGKNVVVYQTHGFSDIASIVYSLGSLGSDDSTRRKFQFFNKRERTITANNALEEISTSMNIPTLNGFNAFCSVEKEECSLISQDRYPLIIDQAHLSIRGIATFEPWLASSLIPILFDPQLYD